jgi:hypothetical protein
MRGRAERRDQRLSGVKSLDSLRSDRRIFAASLKEGRNRARFCEIILNEGVADVVAVGQDQGCRASLCTFAGGGLILNLDDPKASQRKGEKTLMRGTRLNDRACFLFLEDLVHVRNNQVHIDGRRIRVRSERRCGEREKGSRECGKRHDPFLHGAQLTLTY